MKKFNIVIMSCLLAFSLCACGTEQNPTDNTQQSAADTTAQTEAQTETTKQTETTEQTAAVTDPKALAESCIDKSVEELYLLVGEPLSTDYAPSCLGPGEDGLLYYDGFVVYTYREDSVETVSYVE